MEAGQTIRHNHTGNRARVDSVLSVGACACVMITPIDKHNNPITPQHNEAYPAWLLRRVGWEVEND